MTPREAAIDGYWNIAESAIAEGRWPEAQRELCRTDLFYLLCVVLHRNDVNNDWLFDRCREVQANPNGNLDMWAREHYKSTIITFGKTIQDILIDPELTVGLFSFTRPIAMQFLRQITREFEKNERLISLFPDIFWESPQKEAPKWSENDGIIVKRRGNPKESTIEAWGLVDGQPISKHFRLMVYDDIVTRRSVTSPEMIEKVTTAWAESRALRTDDGGAVRYSGTRWHINDTYSAILNRGAAIERRHTATNDGTEHGEPVLKSKDWLREQRRDMGPYVFSAQMLLDPSADKAQGFRDQWLRYWPTIKDNGDINDIGADMNKYILVDAASEKKKYSDYTSIGVIGLCSDNNYYVLDMVHDRLNLTERVAALFSLHRRWKPRGVGYERYGMMADVEYARIKMGEDNYRFNIVEVGGSQPKHDRIRRLVPLFESGRFWLPDTLRKTDYEGNNVDLVRAFVDNEYRSFPVSTHDDTLDMFSRIFDIDTTWPRADDRSDDRYARPRYARSRHRSAWAA